ncbi:LytTR family transcriptional regulator DNA-binding domain-containing protein [Fredinandcohnia salidurans]|uniref:LytTR family transcriptional regulator DNA-binding domain-containing protein n=1 Tax=Fredinandcohnia salidurans TaxID=2595041 RepID=A0ABW4MRK5_9BACI
MSKYLRKVQHTFNDTGMVFKFVKKESGFFHTFCDGELLYKLGFKPDDIMEYTLFDFYPEDYAAEKQKYYQIAWNGNFCAFECNIDGFSYITTLRPLFKNGKVIEVIGTSINISDRKAFEEANQQIENLSMPLLPMSEGVSLERIEASLSIDRTEKRDLMIKHHNSHIFIPMGDVYFIEKNDRKSIVHTVTGQYETNEPLSNLEKKVDERFLTSHRSNIINMDLLYKIETIGQICIGSFKDYKEKAKITKNKIKLIQDYKTFFNN